jgi:hypothetical protein
MQGMQQDKDVEFFSPENFQVRATTMAHRSISDIHPVFPFVAQRKDH